jgi:hypothetical protein
MYNYNCDDVDNADAHVHDDNGHLHFVLFRSISFSLLMLRIWVIYSDYNIIAIIAIILISGQVRWATSAAKYTLSHTLHYLEAQESTILRHSWRQAVLDLGKVTDGTAKK